MELQIADEAGYSMCPNQQCVCTQRASVQETCHAGPSHPDQNHGSFSGTGVYCARVESGAVIELGLSVNIGGGRQSGDGVPTCSKPNVLLATYLSPLPQGLFSVNYFN